MMRNDGIVNLATSDWIKLVSIVTVVGIAVVGGQFSMFGKLGDIGSKISTIEAKLDGAASRVDRIERRQDAFDTRQDANDRRQNASDGRQDTNERKHHPE